MDEDGNIIEEVKMPHDDLLKQQIKSLYELNSDDSIIVKALVLNEGMLQIIEVNTSSRMQTTDSSS